jgi:hypothetical protein
MKCNTNPHIYKLIMEQQDIKDIIKMLNDAIEDKDLDIIEETIEQLKEFLD